VVNPVIDLLARTVELSSDLLLRSVPVMILGVLAAELLIALGITGRIAGIARPFTNFSHLSHECGAAFMMAFISSTAANAMLVDYFHNDHISRRELIIASLMNSFPATVMHWRILLPVYIPLLGVAGAIYFALLTFVGLIKTLLVMVAGRILLRGREDTPASPPVPVDQKPRDIPREVARSAKKPVVRILTITIPTVIIVALLMEAGFIEMLARWMEGIGGVFPVPVEGLGIIAAQFASYIAAASLASPLYFSGGISTRDLVITLLVGNLLSSVVRSIRWFGPAYVGIFGPKIGTEIMLLSTILRNGIILILIFLLAWIW
jgi:hypothetical protein